jgi:hypothetical protein
MIGTVIAQTMASGQTKADIEQQIRATYKDTADTLGEQREVARQNTEGTERSAVLGSGLPV